MLAVLEGLDTSRFDPVLCCVNGLGDLEDEARSLGFDPIVLGRRNRGDLTGVITLARIVRERRADIVHGWLYLANVFARAGGRLGGARAIVAAEGAPIAHPPMSERKARARARFERGLARITDAIVANSETVANALLAQGLPAQKIVVIRNGVAIPPPLDRRERAHLRASVGATGEERLVGMVARLDSDAKDHATLLRAHARLRPRFPDVRVVIVGDGFARHPLEALADELGVVDSVTFTGYRPDARRVLGALDVSALLSYTEGMSNVLLESMSWGLPLVITDIPANREAVDELAQDVLVPVGDVDATAAAIARLLDDPATAAAIGARARGRAAEHFSLAAQAEQTMELYERLLERKGRR